MIHEFDPGDDDSVAVVKILGAPSTSAPTSGCTSPRRAMYHRAQHADQHRQRQILQPAGDRPARRAVHPEPAPARSVRVGPQRPRVTGPRVPPGAYGFRSILFDLGKAPFADLVKRFQDPGSGVHGLNNVELVVEDVVCPASELRVPAADPWHVRHPAQDHRPQQTSSRRTR